MGIALLVVCAIFARQVWMLPKPNGAHLFTAATFPMAVLMLLSLSSGMLVVKAFTGTTRAAQWPSRAILLPVLTVMTLIVLYAGAFILAGEYAIQEGWIQGSVFCATTAPFVFTAQRVCGATNMKRAGIIALGMTLALYVVFALLFNVPLP